VFYYPCRMAVAFTVLCFDSLLRMFYFVAAIRVYRMIGDVGMVMALQSIRVSMLKYYKTCHQVES